MRRHWVFLYLAYLSRPSHDRALYRWMRKAKPQKVLELGLGLGVRARRVIDYARLLRPGQTIEYSAVDLFEMRSEGQEPGLSLKLAHKTLISTGARIRLLPGDPYTALARSANALGPQDLILIRADQDRAALERAWFYVPRLMHDTTRLVLEERTAEGGVAVRLPSRDEIDRAAQSLRRRAA